MNTAMRWALAAVTLAFVVQNGTLAGNIPIPNYSFESPATPYVSVYIVSWQKYAPPAGFTLPGGYAWTNTTGIFKNDPPSVPDHIDNCDGNQALWLFADSYTGVFQDYDSVDSFNQTHQFNAVYTPGKSYHLTVGVIGTGGGMLPNATLQLMLYYRDAASNQVAVASTILSNTPTVFSNNTHFVDCNVDVPTVKVSDAWAGQHIGILFLSTVDTNSQGGYWDLDNVRLVEGPALSKPAYTNGQFSFSLLGQPGATFEIQSATDAIAQATSWTTAGFITNVARTSSFNVSATASQTFYRARQLP
jgi:hypothetical protein